MIEHRDVYRVQVFQRGKGLVLSVKVASNNKNQARTVGLRLAAQKKIKASSIRATKLNDDIYIAGW
jgi:hypothetical protein